MLHILTEFLDHPLTRSLRSLHRHLACKRSNFNQIIHNYATEYLFIRYLYACTYTFKITLFLYGYAKLYTRINV